MVERDAVDHRCSDWRGFGLDVRHLTSAADAYPLARPIEDKDQVHCSKFEQLT